MNIPEIPTFNILNFDSAPWGKPQIGSRLVWKRHVACQNFDPDNNSGHGYAAQEGLNMTASVVVTPYKNVSGAK
jgi:hypothetical protein